MCTSREQNENGQIRNISSFVLLGQRDVRALRVLSAAASSILRGDRNQKAEDTRTECASPPWYLIEVSG